MLKSTKGPLHRLKISRTLLRKRVKIGPEFLPALRKCCFLLYCQASQAEISKRNSTKICQTVDGINRINNLPQEL